MSRVQLALRVADLEAAVGFHSRLFGTAPAKRRPSAGRGTRPSRSPSRRSSSCCWRASPARPRLDHLGVEAPSTGEVFAAADRLSAAGPPTRVEDDTTCCYAVQDKVWVTGPGGEPWEVYTVTGEASRI